MVAGTRNGVGWVASGPYRWAGLDESGKNLPTVSERGEPLLAQIGSAGVGATNGGLTTMAATVEPRTSMATWSPTST